VDLLGIMLLKALKETKEIQVLLDPPVMLAPKELKVLKEIKEIKVQLVMLL
jgi:predicted metallo-beta-lactamase superfamily hydrolase